MTNSVRREARLAAYGVLAGVAGGQAAADIQVYEGDPIPIEGNAINLSMGDIDFTFAAQIGGQNGLSVNTAWSCCSWYYNTWTSFCNSSIIRSSAVEYSSFNLDLSCLSGMSSMAIGEKGDTVNGGNSCYSNTFICEESTEYWTDCFSSGSSTTGTCDQKRRFYVGFTANDDGSGVFGWMLIEGTGSDLAITRWAYESSGASIEIGEEPAPKCNADINGDGKVDGADLGLLLSAWGDCEE